jgi:Cys-tRNA(Pro)/Cys-tRNA(Cys) deacylase
MKKTNSMRLLESLDVAYQVHEFSDDIHSADGVAEALSVPVQQVYKTLVVLRERGKPLLVMLPGDSSLDLKELARQVGEKRLRMATYHEAEALTGLQVGGISALALVHKNFDVYADKAILSSATILVSAGVRGVNLSMHPSDLLRVTAARTVDVTREGEELIT